MTIARLCTFGRVRRFLTQLLVVVYACLVLFALFNRRSRVKYTVPNVFDVGGFGGYMTMTEIARSNSTLEREMCRLQWDQLYFQSVNAFDVPTMEEVMEDNSMVKEGGQWEPEDCTPFQRVAILIPYRDRNMHLRILLNRLHPMLRRQKISYRIFVVEQAGGEKFNRGLLMNIGFVEALKRDKFDCIIFHDVDLVPEHDRNVYLCDDHARHLASAIDETRYHTMYSQYMGGVLALSAQNTQRINGFSNVYWGWGQEDDDMSARTAYSDLLLTRPPERIGRYKMVRHKKSAGSDLGIGLFMHWRSRWKTDGLNSLNGKYKLMKEITEKLYTQLVVDIGKAPSFEEAMKANGNAEQESFLWYLWFYFP